MWPARPFCAKELLALSLPFADCFADLVPGTQLAPGCCDVCAWSTGAWRGPGGTQSGCSWSVATRVVPAYGHADMHSGLISASAIVNHD
jgi:hypothetical protein